MRTASLRGKSLTEVKLVTWQSACVLHTVQNVRIASSLSSAPDASGREANSSQ